MGRTEPELPALKLKKITIALVAMAGIHAFAWGLVMLLVPEQYFQFSGLSERHVIPGAQAWGMFGLIGGLLFVASVAMPTQMGRVSLLFFFMNLLGLGAMTYWLWQGPITLQAGLLHSACYMSGVVGFGIAGWNHYRWKRDQKVAKRYFEGGSVGQILKEFKDQHGNSLEQLNELSPVLLVFLRHFGCTFCREALSDLRVHREEIEAGGVRVGVVHMVDDATAAAYIAKYPGLEGVARISDPEKRLYQAFELKRGDFGQLFGLKSWVEGFRAGILNGHLIGKETGDGFQMPGIFLLHHGEILRGFRHQSAADRPDYCLTADCEPANVQETVAFS